MAILQRLEISSLRNLDAVKLIPSPHINILFGDNGSGKTSVLEAIHLLGLGRSFRSSRIDSVIQDGAESAVVFAQLDKGLGVGLEKTRRQNPILKLQGERQRNWIEVARQIPVQVINSESFLLLEGSPKIRRRFLDWGVFHVEHDFMSHWRTATRILAQRNALLKQGNTDQLLGWDHELASAAHAIDAARRRYFECFIPLARQSIDELLPRMPLSFEYIRGWDDAIDYAHILREGLSRDLRYGATQAGPHRADLLVKHAARPAAEVLSRGQQKLLVSALKIAQGRLLDEHSGERGIYLVDDLPAELDRHNRDRVCQLLLALGAQVFITGVELAELENTVGGAQTLQTFHVEHGKMAPVV
jgi:DNA replication and repair protein RecF